MQKIDTATIRRWTSNNKAAFPAAVPTHCPHCVSLVIFSLSYPNYDAKRRSINHSAACPACDEIVNFTTHNDEDQRATAIYMFPECTGYRECIYEKNDLPAPLYRAYLSIINSLNSLNLSSAASGCSRALELSLRNLAPDAPKSATPEELINIVAEKSPSLEASLKNLSELIKPGGTLRRYFDMDLQPDRETTVAMVDLIEDLISYFFTLPNEIAKLGRKLESISMKSPSRTAPSTPKSDPPIESPEKSGIRQITIP